MTYHEVVGTWSYPSLAISTAIVSGNNADFDGDCIHVIPATNLMSRAELVYLCHPRYNMIVQNQLRVKFDHDEIETLYSVFGLTGDAIHAVIRDLAVTTSSEDAYKLFCDLKRYCKWVWDFQGVATITFKDFLDISAYFRDDEECLEYAEFVRKVFPDSISPDNGIKKLINSRASRFSVDHLWQIFGYINEDAKERGGFLKGMTKADFITMAPLSRSAMIKDVAYYGYSQIKLTHCTKSIFMAYDGRLYTSDNILVATNIKDVY